MKKKEGKFVCRCECGGQVRGVESFGRLWTWCEKCTPKTEDEAAEAMDNGRNTGGKSYRT